MKEEKPRSDPLTPKMSLKREASDLSGSCKRFNASIDKQLMCPITHQLLIDPVVAEDGKVYERTAIEDWLEKNKRSPITNLPMGATLFAATHVKSLIELTVSYDTLSEEMVSVWKQRMEAREKIQTSIEKARRAAEGGNIEAAWMLGNLYFVGCPEVPRDLAVAFGHYKRAAEAGHADSAGSTAQAYLCGFGVAKNEAQALRWPSVASERGGVLGKWVLSHFYERGTLGMPVDMELSFQRKQATADADNVSSKGLYLLATYYEKGIGTAVDMAKAEALRRIAAKKEFPGDEHGRKREAEEARKAVVRKFLYWLSSFD